MSGSFPARTTVAHKTSEPIVIYPYAGQHPASSQMEPKRTREEDPIEQTSNKDLEETLHRAGIGWQEKLSAARKAETLYLEIEAEWENRKREKRQA